MARLSEGSGIIKKPAPQNADRTYDEKIATQKATADKAAADNDSYYTKIISNGKTQAQLDAAAAQAEAVIGAKTATTVGTKINLTPQQIAANEQIMAAKLQKEEANEGQRLAAEGKILAEKQVAAAKVLTDAALLKAKKDAEAAAKAIADAKTAAELKIAQDAVTAANAALAAAQTAAANDAASAALLLANQQIEFKKFMADQVASSNKVLAEQMAASKLAYDTAAAEKAEALKVERTSAFETLKAEFTKYGLGSLADEVKNLILNGTSKSQATLVLRGTEQYKLRFAGNSIRLKEGRNLYDESTYLSLENDFQESFAAYGQTKLLGPTRESAQAMFAEYIGMDKSPVEIKNRIKLAVDEVKGRPEILKTFNTYFPSLDEQDLVSYFLDPKDTLSRLQTKVQTAQIGTAATRQGLVSNAATSLDLAQFGITEEMANLGYQKAARDLPTLTKLGNIEGEILNQATTENAYLKGLASEQRKIDKAAERERNRFAQSFGTNKASLTDAKTAGQY